MSRRLPPYLFAGLLGAISGVYIFRPLFVDTATMREIRGETGTVKPTDRPQSHAAPQDGK